MIPEVLEEYNEDYKFFYDAAMGKADFWDEEIPPHEVIERIVHGEHPIKVFRQYRRMNIEQLSRMSGISVESIRKIEAGQYFPGKMVFQKLAGALMVQVEDIY